MRHGTCARRGPSSFADVVICQMLAEFYYVRNGIRLHAQPSQPIRVSIMKRMVAIIMLELKHSKCIR